MPTWPRRSGRSRRRGRSVHKRHVVAVARAAFIVALSAGTVSAQSSGPSGLEYRRLTATPGKVHAIVLPGPNTVPTGWAPSDFAIVVKEGGGVGSLTVAPMTGPTKTVVALDMSITFKRGFGKSLAEPVITKYAALVAQGDSIGLAIIGAQTSSSVALRTDSSAFLVDVSGAMSGKSELQSLVYAGIRASVAEAARDVYSGVREVIVFTDGGEEQPVSADEWNMLIADARDKGVRVSVILPIPTTAPIGSTTAMWGSTLSSLAAIANATGGAFNDSGVEDAAVVALKAAREEAQRWLVVEGTLCGVQQGRDIKVRVEYKPLGQTKSWTEYRTLVPVSATGMDSPCADPAAAAAGLCAKPCAVWEECRAGKCEARTCDKGCPDGSVCGPGKLCRAAQPAAAWSWWLWVVVGGGALLVVAGLLVARRSRRSAEAVSFEEVMYPEPPPVEPPLPTPEPESLGPIVAPLAALPEIHLVAIGGSITAGERWRLHKPRMSAGASSDPADGNDLVFPIGKVSGRHAMFELYPSGDLWVTDVGSRNGTFVNNRQLTANERTKLRVGDQLKLSQNLTLEVSIPGTGPVGRVEEPVDGERSGNAEGFAARKKRTVFDPGNR